MPKYLCKHVWHYKGKALCKQFDTGTGLKANPKVDLPTKNRLPFAALMLSKCKDQPQQPFGRVGGVMTVQLIH